MVTKRAKSIIFAVFLLFTFALFPYHAFAEDACDIAGVSDPLICGSSRGDEETELMFRVRNILNVVYLWIGIIAVIFIVVGGIYYMTSAGDSAKIQRAKNTILYSVCGLVVTLSAFAITNFAIGALDGRTPDGSGGGGTVSSDEDHYKVKSIIASGGTTLTIGQKIQLRARTVPDYAKNQTIEYKSSNESIATVSRKGVVTAKKDGTVTITASSPDGPKKDIKIKVIKPVEVEKVTVTPDKVTLKKGKTAIAKASIEPKNAANKTITWSSTDNTVATVDKTGKIKAKKVGKTTVTAQSANGKKASIVVTVGEEAATTKFPDWVEKLRYKQGGSEYDQQHFGVPEACGLIAVTTSIQILNNDQSLTPKAVAEKVRSKVSGSVRSDGVNLQWWALRSNAPRLYGLTSDELFTGNLTDKKIASLKTHLQKGHMVVANSLEGYYLRATGGKGVYHGNHTIMFYKYENNKYWAKDSAGSSASSSIGYTENDLHNLFRDGTTNSVWWIGKK